MQIKCRFLTNKKKIGCVLCLLMMVNLGAWLGGLHQVPKEALEEENQCVEWNDIYPKSAPEVVKFEWNQSFSNPTDSNPSRHRDTLYPRTSKSVVMLIV